MRKYRRKKPSLEKTLLAYALIITFLTQVSLFYQAYKLRQGIELIYKEVVHQRDKAGE